MTTAHRSHETAAFLAHDADTALPRASKFRRSEGVLATVLAAASIIGAAAWDGPALRAEPNPHSSTAKASKGKPKKGSKAQGKSANGSPDVLIRGPSGPMLEIQCKGPFAQEIESLLHDVLASRSA